MSLEELDDMRLRFVFDYLQAMTDMKPEKLLKVKDDTVTMDRILEFFENQEEQLMIIILLSGGQMEVYNRFPAAMKNKGYYFVKNQPVSFEKNIDMNQLKSGVIYGDLHKSPIHHFIAFVNSVLAPFILNDKNREDWPESLNEYVKRDLYNLQKKSEFVLAKMEGRTHLAHPVKLDKLEEGQDPITAKGEDAIGSMLCSIEMTVVDWNKQVNECLEQSLEMLVPSGQLPLPSHEFGFWNQRTNSLYNIYDQLVHPQVKKMAVILEDTGSAYTTLYRNLFKKVVRGVIEAETIVIFLTPLMKYLDNLETLSFEECKPSIQPLVHLLALIWVNCEYYREPNRMVLLIKEIANLLIQQCRLYLDPSEIVKEEPDDGLKKLDDSLGILYHFRRVVDEYRVNVKESCIQHGIEPTEWYFHNNWIFKRLNAFIERLELIKKYFNHNVDYNRLEKVEVLGIVGAKLSRSLADMYEEYQSAYKNFTDQNMDCLSTDDDVFLNEIQKYFKMIENYDHRMTSILLRSFSNCPDAAAMFKTIIMFGPLLDRPLIAPYVEHCFYDLVELMHKDLDECKLILDRHSDDEELLKHAIFKNLPPVSGAMAWSLQLLRRVDALMKPFQHIDHLAARTERADKLKQKYEELVTLLSDFRKLKLKELCDSAPEKCRVNLQLPLLRREPENRLLAVNFDNQLIEVLREVHYLLMMSGEGPCEHEIPPEFKTAVPSPVDQVKEKLPPESIELFERAESLREARLKLNQIANAYNTVLQQTYTVEYPLISTDVENLDDSLAPAFEEMNWEDYEISFIDSNLVTISDLRDRVLTAHENLQKISALASLWNNLPLYQGKERKYDCLIPLEDRESIREARYCEMVDAADKILRLVAENMYLYNATPDSPEWIAYQEAMEDVILEGLTEAVRYSLAYMSDHTDKTKSEMPLMQGSLIIDGTQLRFTPAMHEAQGESLMDLVDSLVQDITDQSRLVPLLSSHPPLPDIRAEREAAEQRAREEVEALEKKEEEEAEGEGDDKEVEKRAEKEEGEAAKGEERREEDEEKREDEEASASMAQEEKSKSLLSKPSDESARISKTIKDRVGFSYQVMQTPEIADLIMKITDHVNAVMRAASEYQANLESSYAFYWAEDRREFIRQFCLYGRLLTRDDIDLNGDITAPEHPPTLDQFREIILKYDKVFEDVEKLEDAHVFDSWMRVDLKPFKVALLTEIRQWSDKFKQFLVDHVTNTLSGLSSFIHDSNEDLSFKVSTDKVGYDKLVTILERLKLIRDAEVATDAGFDPLRETVALLKEFGEELPDSVVKLLEVLPAQWNELKNFSVITKQKVQPLQEREVQNIRALSIEYDEQASAMRREFAESNIFQYECPNPYSQLDMWDVRLSAIEKNVAAMQVSAKSFDVRDIPNYVDLKAMRREMKANKKMWDLVETFKSYVTSWRTQLWKQVDFEAIEDVIRDISLVLRSMDKDVKKWPVYKGLEAALKDIGASMSAVGDLQNPAVKDRHWVELMHDTGAVIDVSDNTTLDALLSLNLHKYEDEVHGIVSKAMNEQKIEADLEKIDSIWKDMYFEYETHERTGLLLSKQTETLTTFLEETQVKVLDMMANRDNAYSIVKITYWNKTLFTADKVLSLWFETQRVWSGLEAIFVLCDDIREQLPKDTDLFFEHDKEFRLLAEEMAKKPKVIEATTSQPELFDNIQAVRNGLAICEKTLAVYLETKRLAFPRFYFVSQADLMDIVSKGKMPEKVFKHLSKLFDSICNLETNQSNANLTALKMEAKDGEVVKFVSTFTLEGQVEEWLNRVLDEMVHTMRVTLSEAVAAYEEKPRDQWIFDYPAQVALTGSQIGWTAEVGIAFARLEEGLENAMKEYNKKQIASLSTLIEMLLTDLTPGDRQKIMTLCTIDVHNRDAVARLIAMKVDNSRAFPWLSQLRVRWDEKMDYKSVGNIYKGLAQSGAWGCFDEFNRIAVEVLSVIAVQVKCIQDAVKTKKSVFDFLGETIPLKRSVGLFITMNPGYAGRTELPENLKALFRPCAMVVPDFGLICEIMLVAEGFLSARILARKFITLYELCKELLSKQDHYDWGLRAIKSVLVVAGSLKRGNREMAEDAVLMRALRDFNTPKIITDDLPVFLGLIRDLFPALEAPRKRNIKLEEEVKEATLDLGLQTEDTFILKVVQLDELFAVRHSVFIDGGAGAGKSEVWRTLYHTHLMNGRTPTAVDLDPKAVTNDELFGVINPATREWKDGLFSTVMRDMANLTHKGPKWIVLDGDIDPMWIESLNTVMDDNKILTLASNERIPLTPTMRLLFEISHLKTATPATVSRAGILYINASDLGWLPYVHSWLDSRVKTNKVLSRTERPALSICFDKYVGPCLDICNTKFKKITTIPDLAHVNMLCYLLESMLDAQKSSKDHREFTKENYEGLFCFCCVWAVGGALFKDQMLDHRQEFHKWWVNEFKVVKFPPNGTIFDYFWSLTSRKFEPWSSLLKHYERDENQPLQNCLVPTVETARVQYFLDKLIQSGKPVMLVGGAGTGKSNILQDMFAHLNSEVFIVKNISFNFYTTSLMLQEILDKSLEKKAGKNYAPPGQFRMIYFIDDLNMPEASVDKYFTVQPHTLMRQHIDYKHFYDRTKLTLKVIHKTQYVAAMNPTVGSFTIQDRLQRHFCTLALSFPDEEAVQSIYTTIMGQHFRNNNMVPSIVKMVPDLITAAIAVHNKITSTFLPTAVCFHYVFNLRDLSNIFQGMLFSEAEAFTTDLSILRLYRHEAMRVYSDKMINKNDVKQALGIITTGITNVFNETPLEALAAEPSLLCHFGRGLEADKQYAQISSMEHITQVLVEGLETYNESNAAMNLVLFGDAVEHVMRVCRILEMPRGNCLLIGVGGSGKQSLSRLASYIVGFEVSQIVLRRNYTMADLKAHMATLYTKTGLKNIPIVFLMTDAQVADESFLVCVNDFLASGEIAGIFNDEDQEGIIKGIRNEAKAMGYLDTSDNCWKYFIEKVRRTLRVVLCFSPVGNTLRTRARRFPALVNCTCIDWFHEWPQEALLSVSLRFLEDCEGLDDNIRASVSNYMAYLHTTVSEISDMYFEKERRRNYTTPKSFLEMIALYKRLTSKQLHEINAMIERLTNGLERLSEAAGQTAELKIQLAQQTVVVNEKNEAANALIQVVSKETEIVSAEKDFVAGEEAKVAVIKNEVEIKQKDCERDLMKAEPALIAAQEALNTLNKNNLSELKALTSPPSDVEMVCSAVMALFAMDGKIPKDRSWKAAKASIMSKADTLLFNLVNYDKEHIHPESKKVALGYVRNSNFNPEVIKTKSLAAAGLCSWVINILKFHDVFLEVKPKRDALDAANEELRQATEKLQGLQDKVRVLEESLNKLTAEFRAATEEKLRCQKMADDTALTLDLANRLVSGFSDEKVRWAQEVENLYQLGKTISGDVIFTTSFISYFGYLSAFFRDELMEKRIRPFLDQQPVQIPRRQNIDPLKMLINGAIVAGWNNDGLPSDRMSIENATILTFCERWPLMVDPQLQAIKWIKNKYGDDLVVTRLTKKGYIDEVINAIQNGQVVLMENLGETIDAILDPVIGRVTIQKGRAMLIGDKEIPYNPNFKLILHTKLANPHYQPELQAQTTLINFTVTRSGLEDQLLAVVVSKERPDLEKLKSDLTKQQNEFKITLKQLEDSLLAKLANTGGNFLGDHSLVENLESNKRTATEIEEKVAEAKVTEVEINVAREHYRNVATRAALIYFIMNDLNRIHPMYQFSLKAFRTVFEWAIDNAPEAETDEERLASLMDSITYAIYIYTTRGLFERDKLIFCVLMVLQIQHYSGDFPQNLIDFLLRYPALPDLKSPIDFLSDLSWGGVQALVKMDTFHDLDKDIIASTKRWKTFVETEAPEKEKLPQEWKNKTEAEKLCIMRALRPDRMTYALTYFISTTFSAKYVEGRQVDFATSYKESRPNVPVFFILSPGVDPLKDVEVLGHKLGFTVDKNNFHNVSLGQGQEIVAESALDLGAIEGHWVVLQNIHLVKRWLPILEKKLEQLGEIANSKFRVFISAEPAPSEDSHIIPQGILENAIKITNEPPTGMQANLHKALDNFTQETLERCSKEAEFKPILFALCYFHAVVSERRKFGAQGWNRSYPFNAGDLRICLDVLYNYLEVSPKVPWDDLRYLFGEIMYGGHITDDWDRRLCRTFLEEYLQPELIDGDLYLAPNFLVAPNSDYMGYHAYIDEALPPESPHLYGLHPNAEIEFLTKNAERVFRMVLELQPRDAAASTVDSVSREEVMLQIIEDLMDRLPDSFNMMELNVRQAPEERTPYTVVAMQECERMNILVAEIQRSLKELRLGLRGELTMSSDMDILSGYLFLDSVPQTWERYAYPSLYPLGLWFADLLSRVKELDVWVQDFTLPGSVWLGGLFNPQSFLTAVMQQTARKFEWPLDRICISVEVTKRSREDMGAAPREGAYVHGLFMEGARWDTGANAVVEARMKELAPPLPVIMLRAVPTDRQEGRLASLYACPVYKTKVRGPTFVWTFHLRTKEKPAKWIMGGVALLLQA
ncbi:Dynein beta chain ciliary [Taenia crassiceps]|uniref:Dynein beta chain ciliary n=1 Tax=Taenia crassiceps TaxID=6207 RepID=A0ABR4QLM6_9CEST